MSDQIIRPDVALTDGAFYASDPHPHFDWMRAHAPLYWDGQVWGITRYADLLLAAKDPQTFRNGGGIRPTQPPMPYMIDLDDPPHRQRRGLVSRGFTPRRVQEHEPRIREISAGLIEQAKARGRFDFVHDVAAWLPLIVIGDLLGVEPDDHARLLAWSEAMIQGDGTTDPEKMMAASAAFDDYITYQRDVIADRRAHPRDDLVSILVHAEIDGERLSENDLLMESLLILIGGDETTRHVLSGGMYELLRAPRAAPDPGARPVAHSRRGRGDAALGEPDPEHGAHRGARRRDGTASASRRGRRCCSSTRRPTAIPPCSASRTASMRRARPTITSRSGSAPTSASAPTWRGSSCACSSRSWFAACPALSSPTPSRRRAGRRISSAASSTFRSSGARRSSPARRKTKDKRQKTKGKRWGGGLLSFVFCLLSFVFRFESRR